MLWLLQARLCGRDWGETVICVDILCLLQHAEVLRLASMADADAADSEAGIGLHYSTSIADSNTAAI